jgi:hypothetical protein
VQALIRILLQANESQDGPAWTDEPISEAFGIHPEQATLGFWWDAIYYDIQ